MEFMCNLPTRFQEEPKNPGRDQLRGAVADMVRRGERHVVGRRVLEYWYRMEQDMRTNSAWVLVFYGTDELAFVATTGSRDGGRSP